jgi:cytidylate kinase
MKYIQIAVDGPAGAGKSTIAKLLAKELSYTYIDTGAMYRAITLKAIEKNIDINIETEFDFIYKTNFKFKKENLFMDGINVSQRVRNNDVSNNVSQVSSYLSVREKLVSIQQLMAKNENVVMDGRDIGYKVLPNANFKFFLTASIDERAERRHKDNLEREIKSDINLLRTEIARRDYLDTTRVHSPLKPADDAIIIDTSHLTIDEVVSLITLRIREVENSGI